MGINQQIKQTKPFVDELFKVIVNIHYSSSWLASRQNKLLKPLDLTIQQFNILRILRGCNGKLVNQKYIKERMIDHSSDISRLINKLYKKNFIKTQAQEKDRRNKAILLTELGSDILNQADQLMEQIRDQIVIEESKLVQLNTILNEIHSKDK